MYLWRKMSDAQREEAANYRRLQRYPKHSPPHFDSDLECTYILTAGCYEHVSVIGKSIERITEFERDLLTVIAAVTSTLYAWCVLPNHYHVLIRTSKLKEIRKGLGLLHGKTAFVWNGEDKARGRKVWHNCFERKMRSEGHFYASLNYVNHNPVHHGYVQKWEDWAWSSGGEYLERVGRENAIKAWKEYPILDYGKNWDIF